MIEIKYDENAVLDLPTIIDDFYANKKRVSRVRDYFYVSEIGKSKKQLYESLKSGKGFEFSPRIKRILENGEYMHQRYTKMFAEMGMLVAAEIFAVENDLIHGRCDCILTDRKENYVIEMKSMSQWIFNKLTKPKPDHKLQLMVYMYYLNIYKGFLLYENKDNQTIKCFLVELDKPYIEEYMEKLRILKEDILNGVVQQDEPVKVEDLNAI